MANKTESKEEVAKQRQEAREQRQAARSQKLANPAAPRGPKNFARFLPSRSERTKAVTR